MSDGLRRFYENNRLVIKNFTSLSFIKIFSLLSPFLYYPVLIRKLGAENYGYILQSHAAVFFIVILVDFGFNISATKEVAKVRENLSILSNVTFSVYIAKTFLFSLAAVVYALIIVMLDLDGIITQIYLIALLIPFGCVFYSEWFLQGIEKMALLAAINALSQLTLLILVFFFIPDLYDLRTVALFLALPFLMNGAITFCYCLLNVSLKNFIFNTKSIWETLVMSSPFFLSKLSAVGFFRANAVLVGSLLGPVAMALFDLADKLVSLLLLPLQMLNQAIYPSIARSKDVGKIKLLILCLLPITVCIYVGSLVFVETFIEYYAGSDMIAAYDLYKFLALVMPISAVSYFIGNTVLVVQGFDREFSFSIIFSTILCFIILWVNIVFFEFSLRSACYLIVIHALLVCAIRLYFCKTKNVFYKDII